MQQPETADRARSYASNPRNSITPDGPESFDVAFSDGFLNSPFTSPEECFQNKTPPSRRSEVSPIFKSIESSEYDAKANASNSSPNSSRHLAEVQFRSRIPARRSSEISPILKSREGVDDVNVYTFSSRPSDVQNIQEVDERPSEIHPAIRDDEFKHSHKEEGLSSRLPLIDEDKVMPANELHRTGAIKRHRRGISDSSVVSFSDELHKANLPSQEIDSLFPMVEELKIFDEKSPRKTKLVETVHDIQDIGTTLLPPYMIANSDALAANEQHGGSELNIDQLPLSSSENISPKNLEINVDLPLVTTRDKSMTSHSSQAEQFNVASDEPIAIIFYQFLSPQLSVSDSCREAFEFTGISRQESDVLPSRGKRRLSRSLSVSKGVRQSCKCLFTQGREKNFENPTLASLKLPVEVLPQQLPQPPTVGLVKHQRKRPNTIDGGVSFEIIEPPAMVVNLPARRKRPKTLDGGLNLGIFREQLFKMLRKFNFGLDQEHPRNKMAKLEPRVLYGYDFDVDCSEVIPVVNKDGTGLDTNVSERKEKKSINLPVDQPMHIPIFSSLPDNLTDVHKTQINEIANETLSSKDIRETITDSQTDSQICETLSVERVSETVILIKMTSVELKCKTETTESTLTPETDETKGIGVQLPLNMLVSCKKFSEADLSDLNQLPRLDNQASSARSQSDSSLRILRTENRAVNYLGQNKYSSVSAICDPISISDPNISGVNGFSSHSNKDVPSTFESAMKNSVPKTDLLNDAQNEVSPNQSRKFKNLPHVKMAVVTSRSDSVTESHVDCEKGLSLDVNVQVDHSPKESCLSRCIDELSNHSDNFKSTSELLNDSLNDSLDSCKELEQKIYEEIIDNPCQNKSHDDGDVIDGSDRNTASSSLVPGEQISSLLRGEIEKLSTSPLVRSSGTFRRSSAYIPSFADPNVNASAGTVKNIKNAFEKR